MLQVLALVSQAIRNMEFVGCMTFPGNIWHEVTVEDFERRHAKRGMAGFMQARQLSSFVKRVEACYPCTAKTDRIVFIAGFYLAYISMRLVLRYLRPYIKTLETPAVIDYVSTLSLTLTPFNTRNIGSLCVQVRTAAMTILGSRNLIEDYIQLSATALEYNKEMKIPLYSGILVVGAQRHLHDIRKGSVYEKSEARVAAFKRNHCGEPIFDLRNTAADRVGVTDEYFWSVEEAWIHASSLHLCVIVVAMSCSRSKSIMAKIASGMNAETLEADLKQLLHAEASETSWKPALSTYDTSTCNVSQNENEPGYARSLWRLADCLFQVLSTEPGNLSQQTKQWISQVKCALPNVGHFRMQHIIGNLLLLNHRHPKTFLTACIPEAMYSFVDPNRYCDLEQFKDMISRQNTLALIKFAYTETTTPKKLSNGFLNLGGEIEEVSSISTGGALDKLIKVYDVLHAVKDDVLKHAIVEERSSARFDLAPEFQTFSAFEVLTNLCMTEHVRKDSTFGGV